MRFKFSILILLFNISNCIFNIFIGLFARGNSHVIRLAVPLQLLFDLFRDDEVEELARTPGSDESLTDGPIDTDRQDRQERREERKKIINSAAILAAHSIVDTCLRHCCKFIIDYRLIPRITVEGCEIQ